jgi:hypothetical protein
LIASKPDAVVQEARQQHPNHPRRALHSGRTEERIDGRPPAVLPGSAADRDVIVTDDQMMAGRGDVNIARREVLALFRRHNRQARGAPEHLGEQAGFMIGRVQHDEKRRRQIGRQVSQQPLKRLDPAHRGANDDDVTLRRLRLRLLICQRTPPHAVTALWHTAACADPSRGASRVRQRFARRICRDRPS